MGAKKGQNIGSKSGTWKGGLADYPGHYEMKQNRIIRIKQTGGKCEVCGEEAKIIHHKDENKSNHALDNLSVLCKKCHSLVHSNQPRKNTLFIRLYGMTLQAMVDKYGGNTAMYYNLHRKKELMDFLLLEQYKESPEHRENLSNEIADGFSKDIPFFNIAKKIKI